MSEFSKIIYFNIIALIIFSLYVSSLAKSDNSMFNTTAFSAGIFMIYQVVINLFLMIIFFMLKKNVIAKAFAVSAGIIFLIGYSVCGSTIIGI